MNLFLVDINVVIAAGYVNRGDGVGAWVCCGDTECEGF